MRLGGIVLCGGQSRRMGSPRPGCASAKKPCCIAWFVYSPARWIRFFVVAAHGQRLPRLPDNVGVIRDRLPDRGPLEGLAAGLEAISRHADAAFVCGCDAPFLHPDFVRRVAHLACEADIAMPYIDGRLHPLAAVYRVSVLPVILDMLDTGSFRLTMLAERCDCRRLSGPRVEGRGS